MKAWIVSLLAVVLTVSATGCELGGDQSGVSQAQFALTGQTCGAYSAPILGAGSINLGTAVVSNSGTDLTIGISSNMLEGWKINELFVFAGTGSIPTDPIGGWTDFQQFPYKKSFYPGTSGVDVLFTLADLYTGDACGLTLNVAVYIVARQYDSEGNVLQARSGWAYSIDYVGSTCPCEAVEFPYTVCCEPPAESGCTLTQGYWKNHNETARSKSLKKDWPQPMDEFGTLCEGDSRTLLEILKTPPASGDAYLILAHQYIAAMLNVANGASTTDEVDQALADALNLLNTNCGQFVHASTADGYSMTLLAGILDSYNNGAVGPGHCSVK